LDGIKGGEPVYMNACEFMWIHCFRRQYRCMKKFQAIKQIIKCNKMWAIKQILIESLSL
jgi:hypothetical protein